MFRPSRVCQMLKAIATFLMSSARKKSNSNEPRYWKSFRMRNFHHIYHILSLWIVIPYFCIIFIIKTKNKKIQLSPLGKKTPTNSMTLVITKNMIIFQFSSDVKHESKWFICGSKWVGVLAWIWQCLSRFLGTFSIQFSFMHSSH